MNSQTNDKNFSEIKVADRNISEGAYGLSNINSSEIVKVEELVSKIPLYNENFNITKKEENGHLNIEKKWITSKKKIEIPVLHEAIFINGKELESFDDSEVGEILSRIKSKLSDVFIREKMEEEQKEIKNANESAISIINTRHKEDSTKKNVLEEKPIPIFDSSGKASTDSYKIELWGEEIIINKRMVKMGEILLRKYEVRENRKIDVDVKKEKLTVKFPGNYKEEIF